MTQSVHVLGFAGSLRRNSFNKALLRTAETLLPAGMSLELFDLAGIPLFNVDEELRSIPQRVQQFHERLRAADAYLIATPEYNYSVTGVLKNALDWASRRAGAETPPINDKVAAIMGAGGRFGTVRAQMHLREILQHNNVHVVVNPQVTIASAWQEFDEDLNLTSERYQKQVRGLLMGLQELTLRLRLPLRPASQDHGQPLLSRN